MTLLSISLLGPVDVRFAGAALAVDTRKAVAIVAYLAVGGRPVARDALAALLWPESGTDEARGALRRTLSVLRTALDGSVLLVDRSTAALDAALIDLDLARFRHSLERVRGHRHPPAEPCAGCLRHLDEAVGLVRGEFMEGFALRDSEPFEEWQLGVGEELRRELAGALERLTRGRLATGESQEALRAARRWLALDPLNEAAHRALMLALAMAGEGSAAVAQYRSCVRILDSELGVGPTPETVELYERVVSGQVNAVTVPRPSDGSPRRDHPRELPLVGRDRELNALETSIRETAGPILVVVSGEAGIGKTRLIEAALDGMRLGGGRVLAGRAHDGEQDLAYAPIVAALRGAAPALVEADLSATSRATLARLLPELGASAVPDADGTRDPAARLRFIEGLVAGLDELLGRIPGSVLAVDDVHWADEATLELLGAVIRRSERGMAIVVGVRPEELGASDAWIALMTSAARDRRLVEMPLPRLELDAVAVLVREALPDASPDLLERLIDEAEGLPLVLVESLAVVAAGTTLVPPTGMRAVLTSRLHGLRDTDRQVLATAAVLGRPAAPDLLRAVSGRTEDETIDAIDALVGRRLLIEHPAATYGPSHGRIRELVVESLTLARRRLLHRRAAEALAARPIGALGDAAVMARLDGSTAAIVAGHLEAAGHEPEAALAFERAGDHDRSLFANREAIAHYQAAIALGHTGRSRLHEAIGDLETLAGDYERALSAYRTSLALAEPDDSSTLSRVEHEVGLVHARRGEWETAELHMAAAQASAPADERGSDQARRAADRGLVAHRRGRGGEASTFATRALEVATLDGHAEAVARAENLLGLLATAAGDLGGAEEHLRRSLASSAALADPTARIAALNNLARVRVRAGDGAAALELVDEAIALCRGLGDRHREAALRNHRADLLNAAGDRDAALEELRRALTIFADVAGRDAPVPGVWLLEAW